MCLLNEIIFHILSQSGHVAKLMRFLEPYRGSAASPKDACRFLKASVPLENARFGRHKMGSAKAPPSGIQVELNFSSLEAHFVCEDIWFLAYGFFRNLEALKAEPL
jgi:hypothetical protein